MSDINPSEFNPIVVLGKTLYKNCPLQGEKEVIRISVTKNAEATKNDYFDETNAMMLILLKDPETNGFKVQIYDDKKVFFTKKINGTELNDEGTREEIYDMIEELDEDFRKNGLFELFINVLQHKFKELGYCD